MITIFPKSISHKAITLYLILLVVTSLIFGYSMEWFGYVWGIIEVFLFFYFGRNFFLSNISLSNIRFKKSVFGAALLIRFAYVFVSYWFYSNFSDKPPFEFSAIDSYNYHTSAITCVDLIKSGISWHDLNLFFGRELDDLGYMYYMTFIYLLTDNSILFLRLINSILSAYIVVFIYNIANRHYDNNTAKLVAVFCAFMPNMIFYCGLHLKETVMVFLVTLFIESADVVLMEDKKWQKWLPMVLSGLVLFSFRTVLGVVAFLAFFSTLLFVNRKKLSFLKRVFVLLAAIGVLSIFVTERIENNIKNVWESKDTSQQISMEWRSYRKNGNEFAKYASAAVFAPLIFTIPFPTLVQTPEQENIRLMNGSNYVKNIMSLFTISAIILMIFSGEWRKHVLILSYTLGYLVVITFSSFAQSERFHQPVLPFEILLAAYGLSLLKTKNGETWYNIWLVFIFVADVGWQWFKLAGRGMF